MDGLEYVGKGYLYLPLPIRHTLPCLPWSAAQTATSHTPVLCFHAALGPCLTAYICAWSTACWWGQSCCPTMRRTRRGCCQTLGNAQFEVCPCPLFSSVVSLCLCRSIVPRAEADWMLSPSLLPRITFPHHPSFCSLPCPVSPSPSSNNTPSTIVWIIHVSNEHVVLPSSIDALIVLVITQCH